MASSRNGGCHCTQNMPNASCTVKLYKSPKFVRREIQVQHFSHILLLLFLQHFAVFWDSAEAQTALPLGIWKTGYWGECNGSSCGPGGIQLRSVFCVHAILHYKTTQNNCITESKPIDERECFKVCPKHKEMFNWKVGFWKTCNSTDTSASSKLACNIPGVQHRTVRCVSTANSSLVVEDYICSVFQDVPNTYQSCNVPCPQNCVTSVFTSWSQCDKSCGNGTQIRRRQVIRNPKFGGLDCSHLSELRPCTNLPPCHKVTESIHKLKFEEWSMCKRAQASMKPYSRSGNKKWGRKERASINEHLIGLRSQQVQCLTPQGKIIGSRFIIEETCEVSQACTVDLWSSWTTCWARCGSNGTQIRIRNIQRLPFGSDSSSCPNLTEKRTCLVEPQNVVACSSYRWASGSWSPCKLIHNSSCGGGQQWRDVYCVQLSRFVRRQTDAAFRIGGEYGANAWAQMQPVNERFCDQNQKLSSWQECSVSCVHQCVMGPWSDWSECALSTCPGDVNYTGHDNTRFKALRVIKGYQRRQRKIFNNYGHPEDCPHTLEVAPCEDARCYHWHVTSLSPCQPEVGVCGPSMMIQTLICRDLWRNTVPDSKCHEPPSALVVPRLLTCHVPCPGDCVLSDWSQWTPCPHSCRRGKKGSQQQIRKRAVLAFPGPTGTPCPRKDSLIQSRQCNQQKCSVYFWNKSRWGPCQMKDTLSPLSVGLTSSQQVENTDNNATNYLVYPQTQSPPVCGVGYQIRQVQCRKKDSESVRRKICMTWDKPITSRACAVGCRQDCILSQWSEWSSCQLECEKLIMNLNSSFHSFAPPNLVSMYQRRRRYVVQHRVGSGEPCRLELEQVRKCTDSQQCSLYQWHSSKWSPCVLARGVTSMFKGRGKCSGINTRSVKCQLLTLSGSAEAESVKCIQFAGPIPHATRPCQADCPKSSKLRKWMKRNGCQATLAPLMGYSFTSPPKTTTPQLGTNEDSDLSRGGRVRVVTRPVGPWSSCIIDEDDFDSSTDCPVSQMTTGAVPKPAYSLARETLQCGIGRRKRALGCFDAENGTMLDVSQCSYRVYVEEDCEVPCPVDCVMSDWSQWGQCGVSGDDIRSIIVPSAASLNLPCGENLQFRFQDFLDQPKHGGRSCPASDQVLQSRPCRTECDETFWVAASWESCDVINATSINSCGLGVQTRNVQCYSTSRSKGHPNYAKRVDDFLLCDISAIPYGSRECNASCPDRCVVSQWSSWQPCNGGSTPGTSGSCSGATRIRTRRIVRQPAVASLSASVVDSLCPEAAELRQTEQCELNTNCFTYSVQWMEWGSCMLGGDAKCGEGSKRRRANCVKSTGRPVHPSKCTESNVTIPAPQSAPCRVQCPIDCLVADWTTWSTCPDECSMSRMRKRTRKILRFPSASGRLCPHDLVQTRPCCIKPCYAWKLAGWGGCQLAEGNCGVGRQRQIAVCRQQDGTTVDHSFCIQQLQASAESDPLPDWFATDQLTRPCEVPCPGQCLVTGWSPWSRCHADCGTDETRVTGISQGVKTRSRVQYVVGNVKGVECDLDETEEQECPAEEAHCFTYEWRTGSFIGDVRSVWCERTQDGLRVSTGCIETDKPAEVMTLPQCTQSCRDISRGLCLPTGVCGCRTPYRAVIQSSHLIACVDPDKQQDQGTVEVVDPRDAFGDGTESETDVKGHLATTPHPPSVVIKPVNESNVDFWNNLNPVKSNGSLKIWAYGAIAGLAILLVFIIATVYLLYSACHKATASKSTRSGRKQRRKHHRRSNSSGSNVGVGLVVTSGGGSSMFGTGGSGLPPYYTAPMSGSTGGQRFPGMRALSRTPSARSGFSFPDRYDSDD
uniref:Thrombospondin type-1 domain-containing protein 7A n=1 Tax=Phallusia mammillata TaxID=59560 RepID=A0A6F9DVB0_9ASCI|nr:thrombospondin type-1 domain-containing protein 7A [Phallusia mammillata]